MTQQQIGQTVTFADAVLAAVVANTPLVIPIPCFGLHTGFPIDSTGAPANVFSGATDRQPPTYGAPSGGGVQLTASPPQWNITGPGQPTFISLWSGFDGDAGAFCIGVGLLLAPGPLAEGDVFSLAACPIAYTNLATAAS